MSHTAIAVLQALKEALIDRQSGKPFDGEVDINSADLSGAVAAWFREGCPMPECETCARRNAWVR